MHSALCTPAPLCTCFRGPINNPPSPSPQKEKFPSCRNENPAAVSAPPARCCIVLRSSCVSAWASRTLPHRCITAYRERGERGREREKESNRKASRRSPEGTLVSSFLFCGWWVRLPLFIMPPLCLAALHDVMYVAPKCCTSGRQVDWQQIMAG